MKESKGSRMKVIAVDDEQLALASSMKALESVFQEDEIIGFDNPEDAITYVKSSILKGIEIRFAFLDVEMYALSGIELAKALKELYPQIHIFFITGYDKYAYEAFRIHARGYLLKPITKETIETELKYYEVQERSDIVIVKQPNIRIQTFGSFELFVDEKPVEFERAKAKELFAYLVDRNGAGVRTAEISAILYEDKEYDRNVRNQTQTVISILMKNLKAEGIEDIIIKKWNYLALDTRKVSCDFYDFLRGDITAINTYIGEYMMNYSWAEFTTASLREKLQDYKRFALGEKYGDSSRRL